MDTIQVILNLPESLVERAKQLGVLNDNDIIRLLEAEITRQEASLRLRENLAKLRTTDSPLTPEEIDTEIRAYRKEKLKSSTDTN